MWKTSLTEPLAQGVGAPLSEQQAESKHTLMKTVHIQLSDKGGDVGVFEILTRRLACVYRSIVPEALQHSRQNFGEFRGGRHDEAIIGTRPGDEMLDAGVFEHTATRPVSHNARSGAGDGWRYL